MIKMKENRSLKEKEEEHYKIVSVQKKKIKRIDVPLCLRKYIIQ